MQAVGGYFEGLREERGLNRAEVAVALKQRLHRSVDPSTIWKIENATMNPGSDMLLALLDALHGSALVMQTLFQRTDASREDGKLLGHQVARSDFRYLTDESADLLRRLAPEEREAALEHLRQMLREQ